MRALALTLALAVPAAPALAQVSAFDPAIRGQVEAIRALRETPSGGLPRSVDLRDKLARGAGDFDQGELNACHDLAAVTVVEAALLRATGERAKLSAADLLIRSTLLKRGGAGDESDTLLSDLSYALAEGLAAENTVPYAKFETSYVPFKEAAASWPVPARAERLADWSARFYAKQDSWWPGKIDRQRRAVKAAVKDFKLVRWLLPSEKMASFAPHALSREACAAQSRPAEDFLLEHLAAGRPVAVGFDAAGLPGPAKDSKTVAGHSAVVVGYRFEDGLPVFTLVNAWGLSLRADQLCRIDEMGVVVTPKG